MVSKIKAIIVKDRRKKVFPLAFGSPGTDPYSTAPYLDELLDKRALNILEGKWDQPLLE